MDPIGSMFGFGWSKPLNTFSKMWYQVFLWALFSSVVVHTVAALIAFLTLRKHKYGKYFPLAILIMGVLTPALTGIVSSAAIAYVYRASSYPMNPLHALFWGCGQTFIMGCMGFTRILATL
ncbi:transmembrane protein 170A [Anthonomus grandis grandis]|uniref:transmembrane protein 170A n=1 Tax=Anthonomus grandis grandis TaxID=2921223 RepID=UPI0021652C9C|nr:transmembrane protein 170A [Anthonomus grandis grandis]XP_050292699.1 transmembrane protein 170A [Anthonomus grandis grandis]